jgi:propionaldehyde dehydrogenase
VLEVAVSEQDIQNIVRNVLQNIGKSIEPTINTASAQSKKLMGIFENIEDANAAAKAAQKEIQPMPLEFREKIIANIRKKTLENAKLFAELGVEETGMGNVGHKILKHQLAAGNPPVLVDETANILKAAEDIVNGATFDNNLPCIAEKEVIAVKSIADELMYYMEQAG